MAAVSEQEEDSSQETEERASLVPNPLSLIPPSPQRRKPRIEKKGAPEPIAALNRIPVLEYARPWEEREPLLDVRTACPNVVVSAHVCPYLRQTVTEMVNRAQASLPEGHTLRVGSALRTLPMQQHGWDNYHKKLREEHPNWPLSALRRATNKYFAPYDQKAPPGHCTGGAIDVSLIGPDGENLPLSDPELGWKVAYTWADNIPAEAKANRMIMVEAMLGAGFSNCRDEYWHYSYGDSGWAVRVGETECPYGWAHPPAALETNFDGANAANLRMETVRDVNGRALHAEGFCAVSPDAPHSQEGVPAFSVGLYWAHGIPVALHIGGGLPDTLPLFLSEDNKKEHWRLVTEMERDERGLCLRLTPQADRVYLSSALPEKKEPSDEAKSS